MSKFLNVKQTESGKLYWGIDKKVGVVLVEAQHCDIKVRSPRGVGMKTVGKRLFMKIVTNQKPSVMEGRFESIHSNFFEPAGENLEPSDEFKLAAASLVD